MNIQSGSKPLKPEPIRARFQPVKHTVRSLVSFYYSRPSKLQETKYVFILGHMRSASSLLTHILLSSDEVYGYGETHLTYREVKDLRLLRAKVLFTLRVFWPDKTKRYYLDKVLHDMYLDLTKCFADSDKSRFIFYVREPEPTISSMIETFGYTQDDACSYYTERLQSLRRQAQAVVTKERSLFFTHAQLINDTELVLQALQKLLGLKRPLSEEYEVLRTTGKPIVGDPSETIKAGRIIRKNRDPGNLIQNDLLDEAKKVYELCCRELKSACETVKVRPKQNAERTRLNLEVRRA